MTQDVIKRLEQAYAERKCTAVKVPEWGVEFNVYPLTLGQLARIEEEPDAFRAAVRTIVVRARDADGLPLFSEEFFEKVLGRGVGPFGPKVILRIRREIDAADVDLPASEEDAVKN